MGNRIPPLIRFMRKVRIDDKTGCWNWLGFQNPNGYGSFRISPVETQTGAHRASWLLHNGEIPPRACVCHKCDNRLCVNPKHLFLGDYSDNMRDAARKGRMAWKPGAPRRDLPRGVHHHASKLTDAAVREALARRFGVSTIAVSRIRRRITWKHVN